MNDELQLAGCNNGDTAGKDKENGTEDHDGNIIAEFSHEGP